jgi:uncharacterized SAM-binding protein YcdF (DUF218 family)
LKIVRRAALLILGILSVLGFGWFWGPIHWNVLNIGNIFGITVCVLIFFGVLLSGRIRSACERNRAVQIATRVVLVLFCAGFAWTVTLTALMISGASAVPPETATVLVLGSKVNGNAPSADLRMRINAAGDYLTAHPQAVCVACGGQGPGENCPEAEAICESLVQKGIDASRIYQEDRSTSTRENINNAQKIIKQNGLEQTVAIVTDEYHEYRACSIAREYGITACAVPARTPWYIFSACWARELLALSAHLLLP